MFLNTIPNPFFKNSKNLKKIKKEIIANAPTINAKMFKDILLLIRNTIKF